MPPPNQGATSKAARLDELILIALAKREQMKADERLASLPDDQNPIAYRSNVREVARFEGWNDGATAVDAAVVRLAKADMLTTDRSPMRPGLDGCRARLRASGYAEAARLTQSQFGAPLVEFERDRVFDENGCGQTEVEFLGERIVVGCVEGEEDEAIRFAHRFEVDTGEVLKAVGGLEHVRAMLMAGILAEGRIDELETQLNTIAPASDRVVNFDHNSPDYVAASAALEHLIEVVRESNIYRETEPDDHERRISELEAGRRLLRSRWASVSTLKATLIGTLTYLALKFVDVPIGDAASAAWKAIAALLGLSI